MGRLPCKFNAVAPYLLVPRLRFIFDRCSRDARIVHWALFKPHKCPMLEPRFVGRKENSENRMIGSQSLTFSNPNTTVLTLAEGQLSNYIGPTTVNERFFYRVPYNLYSWGSTMQNKNRFSEAELANSFGTAWPGYEANVDKIMNLELNKNTSTN